MKEKGKPPLIMADDYEVRDSIEELRAHFDELKTIEQFKSGELLTWLEARYYDTVAENVRELMREYEEQKTHAKVNLHLRAMRENLAEMKALGERLEEAQKLLKEQHDDIIAEKVAALAQEYENVKKKLSAPSKAHNGSWWASLAQSLEEPEKELDDANIGERLREILGVSQAAKQKRVTEREAEKRARLREKTDDETILSHAVQTAFTQEDMAELLDAGEREIYLCGKEFEIPMRVEDVYYAGVLENPVVHIAAATMYELKQKGISFSNVTIDFLEDEMENFLAGIRSAERREFGKDVMPEVLILDSFCSGGKSDIRASIQQAADDAENRLADAMGREIERRLGRLETLQEDYDRMQEERNVSVEPPTPALKELRRILTAGHEHICKETEGKLAKKLLSSARYEIDCFDLRHGLTFTLDNVNTLDDVSDRLQQRIIAEYQKRDMEGAVKSYLRSLRRGAERLAKAQRKEDKKENSRMTA